MPAAVAPPPIGPGSTTTTVRARRRALLRAGRAHDAAAGDGYVVAGAHAPADSVAERVALVEDQVGLRVHVRRAGDLGIELAIHHGDRAFEDAADDALLAPDLARLQFAIGVQAGQLGAGAGAARRAVVGLAGAQHEVLAVGARRQWAARTARCGRSPRRRRR